MRVAALYDIHGNLPALEVVLEEIAHENVDLVVVGGDVVAGPMPRETLETLLALSIPVQFIQGNAESEVLRQMEGQPAGTVPESVLPLIRWVAGQLEPAHRKVMTSWPLTLQLEIEGLGEVLFCHATPRNNTEIFTRLTPEERLVPVFANARASLVVCGHTHMPFDRRIGSIRMVNAGSVGMPYGEPGAHWLLLDSRVQFRQTRYDLVQAAQRIQATAYPQAREMAEENILKTPSEAEVLAVFEPMALKPEV